MVDATRSVTWIRSFRLAGALLALAALVAAGCASAPRFPELGGLYNRTARYHGPGRNPIVVIPGILGSRLVDGETNRVVWGAFEGDYADPRDPEGARLIAVPMGDGPLAAHRDAVTSVGALDRLRLRLLGLTLEQRAYYQILLTLGAGGYTDEELAMAGAIDYGEGHFTCFQFHYDWRRDNVENAKLLHEFLESRKTYVEGELRTRFGVEEPDVKFDIVAHSMGGLLTRYYLMYGPEDLPDDGPLPEVSWKGAELVERAILVGTPNAGSVDALLQLVDGISFSFVLPFYSATLLGTMPAIYQLLPRVRHGAVVEGADATSDTPVDLFAVETWQRFGWGLADPDPKVLAHVLPDVADPEERRRLALDHLDKSLQRAERLAEALDTPARTPDGLDLYLFAGDAVETRSRLRVDSVTGELSVIETGPGDNVVLRSSAVLDERVGGEWRPELVTPIDWRQTTFLFSNHLGLTTDPAFTDNVLYLLLEDPRGRTGTE